MANNQSQYFSYTIQQRLYCNKYQSIDDGYLNKLCELYTKDDCYLHTLPIAIFNIIIEEVKYKIFEPKIFKNNRNDCIRHYLSRFTQHQMFVMKLFYDKNDNIADEILFMQKIYDLYRVIEFRDYDIKFSESCFVSFYLFSSLLKTITIGNRHNYEKYSLQPTEVQITPITEINDYKNR